MWFVYVLLCEGGSLYAGYTDNIEKRFATHIEGRGGRYTRSHKPIKVIYSEEFSTKSEALKREAQIKGWKRDEKIKNLNLKKLY